MITATIVTRAKKHGIYTESRKMHLFHTMDKAKKILAPIADTQVECRKKKVTPPQEILSVSYDTDSERKLLLEIRAILSIDNEEAFK